MIFMKIWQKISITQLFSSNSNNLHQKIYINQNTNKAHQTLININQLISIIINIIRLNSQKINKI